MHINVILSTINFNHLNYYSNTLLLIIKYIHNNLNADTEKFFITNMHVSKYTYIGNKMHFSNKNYKFTSSYPVGRKRFFF